MACSILSSKGPSAQKRSWRSKSTARLHVDVSGYRAARRQALADFALKVAQQAVETGREQALDPMNSADRKVVHDALIEVDGVETLSEGDDPRRYVVIRPA